MHVVSGCLLNGILRQGFAAAHRRLGFVFIDFLWKAIWFGATVAGVFLVISAYGSKLRSLEWQAAGVPALLQQFWDAYKTDLFWTIVTFLSIAFAIWLVLEAFFRSRMARTNSFNVFFVSGTVKFAILTASALILCLISFGAFLTTPVSEWPQLWAETRGAAAAAGITFVGVAFLLTIFETLMRSNAAVLLGTDLIRLTAMVGILVMFEVMIDASVVIAVLAGLLNVSRLAEAIAMAGAAGIACVFLSVLHSYLLLVRFSAVDIMRHNVIEI